jgi:hypothetical protein
MNWVLRFLPEDTRQLIVLGQRIIASLDTPEERREAVQYGIEMFVDGRVEVGEWAKFGSKLGVLRAPKRKPKTPKV